MLMNSSNIQSLNCSKTALLSGLNCKFYRYCHCHCHCYHHCFFVTGFYPSSSIQWSLSNILHPTIFKPMVSWPWNIHSYVFNCKISADRVIFCKHSFIYGMATSSLKQSKHHQSVGHLEPHQKGIVLSIRCIQSLMDDNSTKPDCP